MPGKLQTSALLWPESRGATSFQPTRRTMPDSTQTAPHRGPVFLSYAREDTAPAQRIAEALRSNGVEVWFDQNELRGGDSWDAKIRRQIKECALFIPVISALTQERHEGYFRRVSADTMDAAGRRVANGTICRPGKTPAWITAQDRGKESCRTFRPRAED